MPTPSQRRAVIDVGTNSVKLLVAQVAGRRVDPLIEQSEQTRLGSGFYETHRLQPAAIAQTARAVAGFARTAAEWSAVSTRVIATSAARDALNQGELLEAIRTTSGLAVEVISGEQEADWAFRGVATTLHFVGDREQRRVRQEPSVQWDPGRHGQPSYRLTASATLWPPKPKLFDNAARTSALTDLLAV